MERIRLSTDFYLDELRSKDRGGDVQVPPALMGNAITVVTGVAQPVRTRWGRRLDVVSGYRTLVHNAEVGGALHSAHLDAQALDLKPEDPDDVDQLHDLVLAMHRAGELPKLGGLGYYPGRWIHVDTRIAPDGHLRRWVGTKHGAER